MARRKRYASSSCAASARPTYPPAASAFSAPSVDPWCSVASLQPVHQLEELYGELDVPQPAGPQLELAVHLRGGDVVDDAAAHLLHVGHEVLALGGLPHER